jgi:hypothetical protein
MKKNMLRYFVSHLDPSDRPSAEKPFEIQLLDAEGRAAATGYFGIGETTLVIQGQLIPMPVLQAARRQRLGQGDYVNEAGVSVPPF